VLGAPLAVLIDAASYLWSAAFLGGLRTREQPAATQGHPSSLRADLAVGLRAIVGPPIVRRMIIAEMALFTAGGFFSAMYSVYCLDDLRLSTTTFGVVIGFGGVGALIGAGAARIAVRTWGLGWTLILMPVLEVAASLLIPAAASFAGAAMIAMLIAHQTLGDGAMSAYQVNAVTLRQTLVPHELLGRANAAVLACTMSLLLVASLVGGALGAIIGTREALVVGPLIGLVAPIALWPLRRMRELPAAPALAVSVAPGGSAPIDTIVA